MSVPYHHNMPQTQEPQKPKAPNLELLLIKAGFSQVRFGPPTKHPQVSIVNPGFNFDAYDFPVTAQKDGVEQHVGTFSIHVRYSPEKEGDEITTRVYNHRGPLMFKVNGEPIKYDRLFFLESRSGREDPYRDLAFP